MMSLVVHDDVVVMYLVMHYDIIVVIPHCAFSPPLGDSSNGTLMMIHDDVTHNVSNAKFSPR